MWTRLNKLVWKWRGALVTAPIVAIVLIGLRLLGLLQPLELAAFDALLQAQIISPSPTRVVIVGITEADLQTYGSLINDAQLTSLLTKIKTQGPRVIGLDLYRDLPIEPGHAQLLKLYQSTPNLLGIQNVGGSTGLSINPPPELQQLGQVAANDIVVDGDSKVRRSLLSLKTKPTPNQPEETILTLGSAMALSYLEAEQVQLESGDADRNQLRLGKATFLPLRSDDGAYSQTDMGGYQILMLSEVRNLGLTIPQVSLSQVLTGKVAQDFFRDRVVVIGYVAESKADFFFTPHRGQGWNLFDRVAGVEIHADLTNQLLAAALDGRPVLQVWSDGLEHLWILAWAAIGAGLSWAQRYQSRRRPMGSQRWWNTLRQRLPWTLLQLLGLGGGLVAGGYWILSRGWWLPIVPALLAMLGSAFVITGHVARTASEMRQTFGRYLTEEVVINLLESPEGFRLGGERRKVTMLMSDLRGFSALSERLSPEKAVEFINIYLAMMTEVIDQYQGTINEFIGDGIFVMFGAPVQRLDDAQRAIACAIGMQLAMQKINERNQELDLPLLEMGIGIHTGEVLAGNIGSQKRAKYTVMGAAVNLASRIESYTVGGQVLISQSTLQEAGMIVHVEGQLRAQFKGAQYTTVLYEVNGIGGRFNLFLPRDDDELIPLRLPVPLQITMVEGKQLQTQIFAGLLLQLATNTAEIETKSAINLFDNLKLNLVTGTRRARGLGDIYAKVIDQSGDRRFHIRFTAISPEVSALLYYLRQE